MERQSRLGRWENLFGGRQSFRHEIASAVEIESEWDFDEHQLDIVLEAIPGSVAPLWGSDESWLYVRRPEGAWKTRIPARCPRGLATHLYARSGAGGAVLGGLAIGSAPFRNGGWREGDARVDIEAAALDRRAEMSASSRKGGIGKMLSLGQTIERQDGRLLVHAGDDFTSPPAYAFEDGILVATDRRTGFKVGYSWAKASKLSDFLRDGSLWLRYQGPWLPALDVSVELGERL